MPSQPTLASLRPGRTVTGIAAALLPFGDDGSVDWTSFRRLLGHVVDAGLGVAVNMDTGFAQLLDRPTRRRVLDVTSEVVGSGFVAGAHVDDGAGDPLDLDGYLDAVDEIVRVGGVPIVFPSHGLNASGDDEWVGFHQRLADRVGEFVGFELGPMFVPHGRIYSLDAYRGLMDIPQCIGAKHSSLSRVAEWDRIALRDRVRPDFKVFTGNDLAIDMVAYGSDYLLGLATFAPDLFARRDALWAAQDPAFWELNDRLQFLGAFSFRDPVPAYRHDAAVFLHERGWIDHPAVAPGAATRPSSDREVLRVIAEQLGVDP